MAMSSATPTAAARNEELFMMDVSCCREPAWATIGRRAREATASAAAAVTPDGRGSDDGRSEKRRDQGTGGDARRRRQHPFAGHNALQARLGGGRRQGLEAFHQAVA